jgi:stage II sporulation protein D
MDVDSLLQHMQPRQDAMAKSRLSSSRNTYWLGVPIALCVLVIVLLIGCSTTLNRQAASTRPPQLRVRLLLSLDQLTLVATQPPIYSTDSDTTRRPLALPRNTPVNVSLTPDGWRIGTTTLGKGTLTIQPTAEGSLAIAPLAAPSEKPSAPRPYRGSYRLVPVAPTRFDVINDVDVEGYLAGVLPRELLKGWHAETYKAQAIIARTYALYERAISGPARGYWDVYADERSQMYGGMLDETEKSLQAVNETQGVVVTYGADGKSPTIFKAYFSACCGGITQSASDVFGDPPIDALMEQNNQTLCNASPRFKWGPVVITKAELSRRIRAWGAYKKRPERDLGTVKEVAIQKTNVLGRPTRFSITDSKGYLYSLQAEEFRSACNWDATGPNAPASKQPTIYSSFVKVISATDSIRFVEGHGWGHGVGMCQWCSERRAEEGMRHEDIVLAAYNHSELMRAY